MATLGTGVVTLADVSKQLDPNSKAANVAEILAQKNAALADIPWMMSNLPTGHQMSVRTSLPTVSTRQANEGVAPTKSTTGQVVEQMTIFESWSEISEEIANLGGNPGSVRASEAKSHIESMSQTVMGIFWYGNPSFDTKQFQGFSLRYASTSGVTGQNIVRAGGSGTDNSSIWLVGWGEDKVFGLYPMGSSAGLKHDDFGLETVETTAGLGGSGTRLRAYRERFQWMCGLGLKDWRYAVRIANIDISNLIATSSAADLGTNMIKAIHRIPNLEGCSPVFYMNRTCFEFLDIQSRWAAGGIAPAAGGLHANSVSGKLSYNEIGGKPIYTFRGIPVRISDQLLDGTEAVVN